MDNLARPRINFEAPYDWAGGDRHQQAEYLRQNGIIFRWNETIIQYVPVAGLPDLEWKPK